MLSAASPGLWAQLGNMSVFIPPGVHGYNSEALRSKVVGQDSRLHVQSGLRHAVAVPGGSFAVLDAGGFGRDIDNPLFPCPAWSKGRNCWTTRRGPQALTSIVCMTCPKSTSSSTPSSRDKTAALLTRTSMLSLYVETIRAASRTDPRSVMSSGTSVSIPLPRAASFTAPHEGE